MSRQYQQLQDRANALDRDNQEMGTLLAQARQQAKVSEDQLAALRDQLRSVTAQLAQTRSEKENTDKRVQTMTASMQRQGGVSINPNNSFLQTLPAINIAGVFVRRDGDVIRIEMPGNSLFESGSARLRPGAANLISDVAAELVRTYPDQIIGVEGHTDNDPDRRQPVAQQPRAVGRPGHDRLRRAGQPHAVAGQPVVRGRPRLEPPDRLQRHARRQAAQPPRRVGGLSRAEAVAAR